MPADAAPAAGPHAEPLVREWRAPFLVDVRLVLSVHRRGPRDPAFRVTGDGAVWRTSLTPDGPGTLRVTARATGPAAAGAGASTRSGGTGPAGAGAVAALSLTAGGSGAAAGAGASTRSGGTGPAGAGAVAALSPAAAGSGAGAGGSGAAAGAGGTGPAGAGAITEVSATAWGPGAAWLLATLPSLLGADDDPAGFRPAHPLLRDLVRRHRGVRVGRSGRVLEALVPAVLEQKVVGPEAHRAWRLLLLKFGDPAPGPAPAGMRVFPPARTWLHIPSWEWHRAGAEAVRARTIATAARAASRVEEIATMAADDADRRLRELPGIGPWTSAEVRQRACGDADAVSVGDYHLPAAVGWALAGRVVDDVGMLELLAPYAGHRYRAARLIELSGAGPPRRGPRMTVRDYRAF
jgi:3-methyladenine DNA glycosylase/8-oxoguanine DNA glycosylase